MRIGIKDERKEEGLTGVKTQERVYRNCSALMRSGYYVYYCFNVISPRALIGLSS
jgi:hypothetical protein